MFQFSEMLQAPNSRVLMNNVLKEHVALDRISWYLKSVCNCLL